MIYVSIIAAVILCATLLLAVAYLNRRRKRQRKLELRLLAGQERLLEEEIEQRQKLLLNFDQQELETQCRQGEEALNQLHTTLVERQACLLNCEDLVHLQQYKIATLAARIATARTKPPTPPLQSPPHHNRSQLEEQLRSKISQLRQGRQFGGN